VVLVLVVVTSGDRAASPSQGSTTRTHAALFLSLSLSCLRETFQRTWYTLMPKKRKAPPPMYTWPLASGPRNTDRSVVVGVHRLVMGWPL
jgi:hypothetical protein